MLRLLFLLLSFNIFVYANNFVYNKADFYVKTQMHKPILDFISYNDKDSFDKKKFVNTINKIQERGLEVYIHGRIEVPSTITTEKVYIYSGENFFFTYYKYWIKKIYYNKNGSYQNKNYFLVDVERDKLGNRFVEYKLYFKLDKPYDIKLSQKDLVPNTYRFKMAPNEKIFKDKFVKAKVYITQ